MYKPATVPSEIIYSWWIFYKKPIRIPAAVAAGGLRQFM